MINYSNFCSTKDCATFLYEYINDDTILIRYSNEANCKHFCISSSDSINTNIALLLSNNSKIYMKKSITERCVICYTCSHNSADDCLQNWFVTVVPHIYENRNYIIGIAKQIYNTTSYLLEMMSFNTFENVLFNNEDILLCSFLYHEDNEAFTVLLHGNHLSCLFDHDDINYIGLRLNEVFFEGNEILMQAKLLECINNRSTLTFVYTKLSNVTKIYFKIHLTYAKDNNCTIVHCVAQNITPTYEANTNVINVLDNFYALFDSSSVALCLLQVENNNSLCIENMNKTFEQLLKQMQISIDTLIPSSVFDSLLLNKKPINFKFTYDHSPKQSFIFDTTIIPLVEQSRITKLILSFVTDHLHPLIFHSNGVSLTPREHQILEYVGNGEKNQFIAYHLNISEGTVKRILSNAYRKLNISSRTELIKKYFT